MGRYKYTNKEKQYNKVLSHQTRALESIPSFDQKPLDEAISSSEELLATLGYSIDNVKKPGVIKKKEVIVPSWTELCRQVEKEIAGEVELESLFTKAELDSNTEFIRLLNEEYKQIHKLDKYDYLISAVAAILAGMTDILLIGIPHSQLSGNEVNKPLSDFVRKWFEEKYPSGALENSKETKVPYDAQDNRHTTVRVEGLSAYYHRLLSLGHDPLLGFVVGIMDIMTGRMTTIDKAGHIVSQIMEVNADRKEVNIFAAIAKQILHLKSDITTSMGLPAPLMDLFNLLQFGSIGEEEKCIAEIVQEMYHEGYDFIHFCSMSIPVMINEVVVRISYAIRRIKEGNAISASIPITTDRSKHPKLGTMLFIAHTGATAINVGKIKFSGNDPLAINYPQWIAFAKYLYQQIKWVLIQKPEYQNAYVRGMIAEDLDSVYTLIDSTFNLFQDDYVFVMDD